MDITRDPFYPIISGKPFMTLTNASINSKKNTISLKFGHDLLRFNFSSFKKHFYHKKPGDVKGKTINDYVSDFFGVPDDAIERSILEFEKCPNDEEKEEIDDYLGLAPVLTISHSEEYEVLEKKGEEKPPPQIGRAHV